MLGPVTEQVDGQTALRFLGEAIQHGIVCTDESAKAAATNSMAVITGVVGYYNRDCCAYLPPAPYQPWSEVVRANGQRL